MNEMSDDQGSLRAGTGCNQAGKPGKESDSLFSALSQVSTVGIFRTDARGNYLCVNERWCKIAGIKQGEALAGGWARAIHPDDREQVAKALFTSRHAQLPFNLEYRIQRPDGEVRWVLGQAAAERNAAGEAVGYIGTITDITEVKQAEQERQEALLRLEKIATQVPGVVFQLRLRPDGSACVPYASEAARDIFRLSPDEIREDASRIFAFVHPDDLESVKSSIQASAQDLTPWQHEFRLKRDDGTVRWLFGNSIPQREADGSTLWHGFVTDITERKKLEAGLRHSEVTLNVAQAVAQIGSWFLDIPANRLEWSSEAYRMFGIPQQKAIDLETFASVIHPDDRALVLKAWDEALAGAPYDIEHRIVTGGQVRWVRERARIERDSEGRPLTGIGTVQDITDRKLAEQAVAESESRFREIFNTVSDAIFIHDAETGRILDVNRRMLEMYGLTREEALACSPDQLSAGTPPYSSAEVVEKIHRARSEGPQTFVWLARARDGHLFWVEVSLQFALIGSQQRVLATVRDITEQKQAEAALQESEYRWKFALEGSGDGLWDWNVANNTVFFSKRWKEMLGYAENEIGNSLNEWEKRIHPDDRAETLATVQAYLDGKTPVYQSEHRVSCKDGSWKWILDRGMVVSRDEEGKPLRMIGTHADITERKRAEEQIHNLAFYDTLTQLPNRRMLNDRMNQAMARSTRSGRYGALLFLDLDNFKPLNDTYGHAVGDLLLKEVAHRIASCVREMDTVARFGGDEFVVMLTELDEDKVESAAQAGIVAEKIRIILAEPYVLRIEQEGKTETTIKHDCTSSIGVVLFIDHEDSPEDIIKWADMAMYHAKENGRNLIRFGYIQPGLLD